MTDHACVPSDPAPVPCPAKLACSGFGRGHHAATVVEFAAAAIDQATVDNFYAAVAYAVDTAAQPIVICDLSRVEFLSVSGLRALTDLDAHALALGIELRFVLCQHSPRRLIKLAQAEHTLAVYRDLSTALCDARPADMYGHTPTLSEWVP